MSLDINPIDHGRHLVCAAMQNPAQHGSLVEAINKCALSLQDRTLFNNRPPEQACYVDPTTELLSSEPGDNRALVDRTDRPTVLRAKSKAEEQAFKLLAHSCGADLTELDRADIVRFLKYKSYHLKGRSWQNTLPKLFDKIRAKSMLSADAKETKLKQRQDRQTKGRIVDLMLERQQLINSYRVCTIVPVAQTDHFQIGSTYCTDEIMQEYAARRQKGMSIQGKKIWQNILAAWKLALRTPRSQLPQNLIEFSEGEISNRVETNDKSPADESLVVATVRRLFSMMALPTAEKILNDIRAKEKEIRSAIRGLHTSSDAIPLVEFNPNASSSQNPKTLSLAERFVSWCVETCMTFVQFFKSLYHRWFSQ